MRTYEDLKQVPISTDKFELFGKGKYYIRECFYSLQGEGVRAGTANVFLRFSLCNLNCNVGGIGFDCDTNHLMGDEFDLSQVVKLVKETNKGNCRWVVITGGEPALQLDRQLIDALHNEGFRIAIETNGTIGLPLETSLSPTLLYNGVMIDWITVAPKTRSEFIKQRFANEVKYVLIPGLDLPPEEAQVIKAKYHLISPGFGVNDKIDPKNPGVVSSETLDWCIQKCLENPKWRLSCQQHKFWKVR